uniref:Uncharacterized protein n=1 Tax=Cacopsylla melanoneura TaxID=428564 RepID=A0A8D8Q4Z8_9HEMI
MKKGHLATLSHCSCTNFCHRGKDKLRNTHCRSKNSSLQTSPKKNPQNGRKILNSSIWQRCSTGIWYFEFRIIIFLFFFLLSSYLFQVSGVSGFSFFIKVFLFFPLKLCFWLIRRSI